MRPFAGPSWQTAPIADPLPDLPSPGEDAALFRAVTSSVQDAIIAADDSSRILFFNPSAERIFGRSTEEMLGRSLTELMPERFREAHHAGIGHVREGGEPRLIGGPPVELVGLRGDGTEFPIELTLGRWRDADGTGFAGVVRDVSERDRARRTLATQYDVAAALAESQDLGEAIGQALCAIGTGMGWQAAQLWTAHEGEGVLRFREAWTEDADALAAFRAASQEVNFAPGRGLPGRVWASGRSAWIHDLLADDNFPRHDAAARAGLHSAVAVPLVAEGRPYGAIEFFADRTRTADPDDLVAMEALGQQLGQFLRRREAEAELVSRERQSRQAAELNDEIVQGLVLAGYHLQDGRHEEGTAVVRQTLAAAKRIVSDLLAGADVVPGGLRRSRAARVSDEE